MTLRAKMMGVTAAILIGLFGLLYLTSHAIVLDGFARLERQEVVEDVQRILNTVVLKTNALVTTTGDWSSWDDTYQFVQDRNPDFIDSNLMDSVFTGLKLNVMAFIDNAGHLVYSKCFDLENNQEVSMSDSLREHLKAGSAMLAAPNSRAVISGIVNLDEGPLLFTSKPILTSLEQGPVEGRLIFGQFMDNGFVEGISDTTLTPFQIYRVGDENTPSDVLQAVGHLSIETPIYAQALNDDTVGGYTVIYDLMGNPAIYGRTNASRYVFRQGQNSLSYLLVALLLAGTICCGIVLWTLDRFVLGRMARLSGALALIRGQKDLTIRVPFEGNDELGNLAHSFNETLDALQESRAILHTNEELLATVFETVPVALVISSMKDGRILSVNRYLRELIGYPLEDLLNRTVNEVGYWNSRSLRNELVETLQRSGTVNGSEALWNTRAGAKLDMLVSMQSIEVSGEACVLGMGVDITVHKRIEKEQLEAKTLRLELEKEREVVELKEHFISIMAHEFRTPLAIIQSSKETLQHYFDRMTPERRQEKLVTIGEQVGQIVELLDEFLTISQSRAGKMQFNPKPLNLVTFCQKLSQQIQMVDKSLHHFVFTSEGELGEVNGDEKLLQHIVVNLLSNAVKYSPDGGEVRLELSRKGDEAMLRVSDEGIGIPQEEQKHLFEAFYRATNTRSIKGTGLGLAIVKECVVAHGGTIHCESEEDKGTAFVVNLPIHGSAEKQNAPEVKFSSPN